MTTPTEARPTAWLCELMQEDGSVRQMFVTEDPDGLRFNDMGEPSPFKVTPLYPLALQPSAPSAEPHPTRADMIAALQFYAAGNHRITVDESAWDTVSGEPVQWLANEAGDMVEDGTIAAEVLAGGLTAEDLADDDDGDDSAPTAPAPLPAALVAAREALFEIDDFIARVNGDDRGNSQHVNTLRKFLDACGAAPLMANGLTEAPSLCVNCAGDGRCMKRQALCSFTCAAPQAATASVAWLVEWRFNGVQWLYLTGQRFSFTADADRALRLARRADADAVLAWVEAHDGTGAPRASGEMLATEHVWCGPAAQTSPAVAAPEPVGWGQLGLRNGHTYVRMHYEGHLYPPPADVARNLNLVPLYASPQAAPVPTVQPLTKAQIEKLREDTFSTGNPFCPCDSKTMRKAVRAAERACAAAWGITLAGIPAAAQPKE